jgi:hypothetical protein
MVEVSEKGEQMGGRGGGSWPSAMERSCGVGPRTLDEPLLLSSTLGPLPLPSLMHPPPGRRNPDEIRNNTTKNDRTEEAFVLLERQ